MSAELCIYLGPYLVCLNSEVMLTHKAKGCSTLTCARYAKRAPIDNSFCSKCGGKMDIIDIPEKAFRVDWHDATSCEALSRGDSGDINGGMTQVFIPNVRRNSPRDFRIDEGAWPRPITEGMIDSEKAWFASVFEVEIQKLINAYGNGSIQWGLCQKYM